MSLNQRNNQYANVFEYERVEIGDGKNTNTVYYNCKLLKDIGKYKKGDEVGAIEGHLNLVIWDKDMEDYEEESEFI
jgi:hypothetical protein